MDNWKNTYYNGKLYLINLKAPRYHLNKVYKFEYLQGFTLGVI